MTSVNEQEWKGVVQRVLEVWSGYQLALEHASVAGTTPTEALLDACRERLPSFMQPHEIRWSAAALPRNPNGKIDRKRVAAGLDSESGRAA